MARWCVNSNCWCAGGVNSINTANNTHCWLGGIWRLEQGFGIIGHPVMGQEIEFKGTQLLNKNFNIF